jgi:hypothetical protein
MPMRYRDSIRCNGILVVITTKSIGNLVTRSVGSRRSRGSWYFRLPRSETALESAFPGRLQCSRALFPFHGEENGHVIFIFVSNFINLPLLLVCLVVLEWLPSCRL